MIWLDYDMLQLKNGGRWEFWVSELPVIARYFDTHARELTKVRVAGEAPVAVAGESGVSAAGDRVLIWDPTRGGMRMPHLHYAGEIYALSESQWAEFSGRALASLGEKLNSAKKVAFESVMEISEAMART